MEQRIIIVTVGISDLTRSKRFYSDVLGWKPVDGDGEIMFYNVGSMSCRAEAKLGYGWLEVAPVSLASASRTSTGSSF
jgi:catechol 2,3-dioxygenase-like lactoylglutathione lyase family enzyme